MSSRPLDSLFARRRSQPEAAGHALSVLHRTAMHVTDECRDAISKCNVEVLVNRNPVVMNRRPFRLLRLAK
jgi:hypothetical protein